ncbi:39S ribosomal protein L18, mitochondrial [Bombina bombina]|uniref:39S ribosomal protein L18, mitochondrial n=1 Tax=Bombina bombina TaxID=8345 RepID=UPI00235A4C4A|nr:39S ribosomal protein L18, mitochondrial [Bombina bombina]
MSVVIRNRSLIQAVRHATTLASFQSSGQAEIDTQENELVSPNFTNRNPRNMERLALALKDRGWATVWPSRQYWHRLKFERSQHHVTAFVEHANGNVLLSASTREWAIKKHLYSTKDVMASENVGRVLAQRCLEAGISYVFFHAIPWEFKSEMVQRFRNAMKEGGVVLSEPRRIYE